MRSILFITICFATLTGCKTYSSLLSAYPDKKEYFLCLESHWKKCESSFIYPMPKTPIEQSYYSDKYLVGLSDKEVKILIGQPSSETDSTLTYSFVFANDCSEAKTAKPIDWILSFNDKMFKLSYKPPLLNPTP